MFVRLKLGYLLLPVGVEDISVISCEALIDLLSLALYCASKESMLSYILPRAGEQLGVGSMTLCGNLKPNISNWEPAVGVGADTDAQGAHTDAEAPKKPSQREVQWQMQQGG